MKTKKSTSFRRKLVACLDNRFYNKQLLKIPQDPSWMTGREKRGIYKSGGEKKVRPSGGILWHTKTKEFVVVNL